MLAIALPNLGSAEVDPLAAALGSRARCGSKHQAPGRAMVRLGLGNGYRYVLIEPAEKTGKEANDAVEALPRQRGF